MSESGLSGDQRRLVRLSAALACGGSGQIEKALHDATHAPGEEVEEAILQSYLFLGYPAALNAFALWRRISGREPAPPVEDDLAEWQDRGAEVCRAVYGGQYPRLREHIRFLHPDMERWMVAEGYGKVLGRPGLPLATRELCISALLAVLGALTQLHSHLRGALNVGAPVEQIEEALDIAGELLDEETRQEVAVTWDRVRARFEESSCS